MLSDHFSFILAACTKKLPRVEVLVGEAIAALLAARFAAHFGCFSLHLEGDCTLTILAINKDHLVSGWPCAPVVADIHSQLLLFEKLTASKVLRCANFGAHLVVKWAASHNVFGTILKNSPFLFSVRIKSGKVSLVKCIFPLSISKEPLLHFSDYYVISSTTCGYVLHPLFGYICHMKMWLIVVGSAHYNTTCNDFNQLSDPGASFVILLCAYIVDKHPFVSFFLVTAILKMMRLRIPLWSIGPTIVQLFFCSNWIWQMEGGSQDFSVDFDIFISRSKLKLLRPSFRSQLYWAYIACLVGNNILPVSLLEKISMVIICCDWVKLEFLMNVLPYDS